MIVPHGFTDFKDALRAGVEIYHTLKQVLKQNQLLSGVGDEGGFAPNLTNKMVLFMLFRRSNQQVINQVNKFQLLWM